MKTTAAIFGLLAAVTAASAPAHQSGDARGETRLATLTTGRVAGTPVNCLNLRDIRSTEIIEGTAIVYRTSANRLYVNYPRSGADFLDRDDILVTRTFGSQLCSIDLVQLVDRTSRFSHGSVSLDRFVPFTKVPVPAEN